MNTRKHITKVALLFTALSTSAIAAMAQTWNLSGNTGVTSSQYLGSIDKKDVIFKTNSIERGRIYGAGGAWRLGGSRNYVKIDSLGKLTFAGTGGYMVSGSKYVFQFASSPNYGLFFNGSPFQYEFRNGSAAPVFTINASTGAGTFKSTVKIGAYTLPATDGTSGQVLKTNGTGGVTWGTVTGVAGTWQLGGNSGTNPSSQFIGTKDSKDFAVRTANNERMRVAANGNVGIGTTNPVAALHIIGSTASITSPGTLQLGQSDHFNLGFDNTQLQARYNGTASDLYLNNNGGYTYIGNSTTSSYGAVIRGSFYGLTGSATSGTGVYGNGGGNSAKGIHGFVSGTGSDALRGNAGGSGSYGLYASSSTSYGVYGYTGDPGSYAGFFQGNVYTTNLYQGSDQKLKKDIKDLSSAMHIINQLHPKQYLFRQDGHYRLMNLPQGEHYGLIAQELEKVLPNLIKETTFDLDRNLPDNDKPVDLKNPTVPIKTANAKTGEVIDFKAVNYIELIPITIKGMQEQDERINMQQETISTLQETVSNQQQQINELKTLLTKLMQNGSFANPGSAALEQNIPNPSRHTTTIRYTVPGTASHASLLVVDAAGKTLKQIKLSPGTGTTTVDATTLSTGAYSYTLVVDGKTIATKQMVITR